MNETTVEPETIQQLAEAIHSYDCLIAVGNRTKPPLSKAVGATPVCMTSISGITQYEPSEFTFTARAGTPVAEIQAVLAERSQYLPFDPMLAQRGATIGGSVAAGLSGPGRFRYGGLRDFLLGVQFFSGQGKTINAGGKVVKNAAGFDIPKFLVGSLGRYGIMTELTFKVFPRPVATHTIAVACQSPQQAAERISRAANSRWELYAIDYRPAEQALMLKLGGPPTAIDAIGKEIRSLWGKDVSDLPHSDAFWEATSELSWSANDTIAKVPTTLHQMVQLCDALRGEAGSGDAADLHASVAGGVMWIAVQGEQRCRALDSLLQTLQLPGLLIRGNGDSCQIGHWIQSKIQAAIKSAMDPDSKFPELATISQVAPAR